MRKTKGLLPRFARGIIAHSEGLLTHVSTVPAGAATTAYLQFRQVLSVDKVKTRLERVVDDVDLVRREDEARDVDEEQRDEDDHEEGGRRPEAALVEDVSLGRLEAVVLLILHEGDVFGHGCAARGAAGVNGAAAQGQGRTHTTSGL